MTHAPRTFVALGGMARFACLADRCEDTCCREWNITIDEAHYRDLGARMSQPGERERFAAAFEPLPAGQRTPAAYARIRPRPEDRACPLLTEAQRCSIHERHGEAALPDVCAAYPRLGRIVGERFELYGALSCPEVVRQTLLAEDGASLEEIEAAETGRVPILARADDAEAALLDELRGGLLYLLDQEEHAVASRLFFLAWFAEEVAPATDAVSAPAGGSGDARAEDPRAAIAAVDEVIELASSPEALTALAEELEAIEAPAEAEEVLIAQLVRLRAIVRPRFVPALDHVLDGYLAEGALVREGDHLLRTAGFRDAWERRLGAVSPAEAARLDGWLLRLARAQLLRDLGPGRGDLEPPVRELLVRLSTLRFLALSHPEVAPAGAELERWFVQLVYQSARLVDHGAELRHALFDGTEALLPSVWELGGLVQLAFGAMPRTRATGRDVGS